MNIPTFAIIGHVNEGKSSIVSTLVEDASVEIEDKPGTTTECREFLVTVDNRQILRVVDTPGFEKARHMLKWLQNYEKASDLPRQQRPDALRQFYNIFLQSSKNDFGQECNLLQRGRMAPSGARPSTGPEKRSAPRAGQRLGGAVASRGRPPARSLRGRDRRY
jgi:hypothetical protein